ncbi:transcription termination factor MTERF4, chloroplastic-like [Beta vulgaris subsp. vulgaris]|uniref:transcription termination factor MTERF4, chloroplastic-like n=1 Tax=Beta vulgaris subsp. vulgaris TaxID=3555 RepID=UPI002036D8FF|nr:transcription termination factor MTERF4, chloroplastic-like [Beta vulgaris subsp. vulgaris]XP_057252234.1 transcription termination factor MTERF4, chloroplastic-like [Beta vulgaris subsp. vulgaris]XP_057252235.1 transcription termination factor MTERF4, chloroplastic-like [Beta vulgaris subsp. vulgaris]XP_057252236.1 transcription termination factor MTERF4, chloroplastic-like [Beta vulgaris subsp. vulgaris]
MLKVRCYYNNGVKTLNFVSNLQQLLLYTTPSSISEKPNPPFANYLVENLGFSKQNARSTSTKLDRLRQIRNTKKVSSYKFTKKADSVVEFLKQNELNDSQIRIVVSSLPLVLFSKVDKTLKPKLELFLKFGFSKSDFAEVVSVNPFALLSCQFVRAIEVLKDVLSYDDDVISIMTKSNWTTVSSICNNLKPNVALLLEYGIPIESIRKRFVQRPSQFLRKTQYFKDVLIRVEEKLGIPRDSLMFLHGLSLLASFTEELIESKFGVFESFGWMRSDVVALIRRNPYCLALSEARVRRSLEFLMNELGYERDYLVSHCALLNYSLEKRIMPRNKILLALKEKGLIKMDYSLYSSLLLNETQFLKRFVLPFEEIHEIYAKHTGRSAVRPLTEGTVGDEA